MNCQDAKQQMDLRVHELVLDAEGRAGGGAPSPYPLPQGGRGGLEGSRGEDSSNQDVSDWSELDAHLDACPQCRAEFEELRRVRRLLATAANDRPNDTEVQTMWTALQAAVAIPATTSLANPKGWWVRNRSLVVSMTGVAAVLMLAFQLGNLHESGFPFGAVRRPAPFSHVDTSLPTGSATSMTQDDPSGWGIPVHKDDARQNREPARVAKGPGSPDRSKAAVLSLGDVRLDAQNEPNFRVPDFGRSAPIIDLQKTSQGGGGGGGGGLPPPGLPPEPPERIANAGGLTAHADVSEHADDYGRVSYGYRVPSGPRDKEERNAATSKAGVSPPNGTKDVAALADTPPAQTQSPVPPNLKIIKTGGLTVQVPAYGDSIARVEKIVQEKSGFIADGSTREEGGGALVGRIVIRVPPERFEETFTALKAVGRVESENVKAADVTAEYVDVEARIHSLQITEERLRDLIANKSFVDKIASLLEVEKELNRVRTEIEQFQGQLRVMADRVGLSTIVLTLREPGRTVPSASLSVEVSTLDEASRRLGDMLAKTDGRLASGKTSKRSDGTLMGNYQLETTLARFAEAVSGVEALGRVEERQVKDQQFNEAGEPWAKQVKCTIALVLFERSRQLPTATVRLEVEKLDEAMKRLGDILQAHDAALASNQATRQSDGSNTAEVRVRVSAGRFAALFEALAPLGRMTSKAVSGEAGRIVGGAAAVPCDVALTLAEKPREVPRGTMSVEVEAFETTRQALSRAIAERQVQVLSSSSSQRNDGTWQGTFRLGVPAKDMEAFVGKVEAFGRVAARQISGLGLGDLSRTDPDALGTIDLTIGEKSTIAPAPDESAASIRARVRDGLGGFYTSIGLIAYGLVVLLPWLLLAGLLGWLVARTRRTLRNRRNVRPQTA